MAIEGISTNAFNEKFGSKEIDLNIVKKLTENIKKEKKDTVITTKEQLKDVDSLTLTERTKELLYGNLSPERLEEHKEYNKKYDLKYYLKQTHLEMEKKHKKFDEDPFWEDPGNQWTAISKALHDRGFYDNMTEEEVKKVETILAKITAGMDFVSNRHGYGTGMRFECYYNEGKPSPFMSSSEAYLELESATAALRVFGEKYIAEEDRDEFNQLVDYFNLHNSYMLEDYESPDESFNRGINNIYTSEMSVDSPINRAIENRNKEELKISIYLGGIKHTKEDKELFKKNLAELFKNLQSENMINENIWKNIEKMFLDYASGNGEKYIKDYVSGKSGYIFEHMKGYWSELEAM